MEREQPVIFIEQKGIEGEGAVASISPIALSTLIQMDAVLRLP